MRWFPCLRGHPSSLLLRLRDRGGRSFLRRSGARLLGSRGEGPGTGLGPVREIEAPCVGIGVRFGSGGRLRFLILGRSSGGVLRCRRHARRYRLDRWSLWDLENSRSWTGV